MSRTDAISAAMARWTRPDALPTMDSLGVVVDATGAVISRRHGFWFDELIVHDAHACRDGPTVAGLVIQAVRDAAPIHVLALDLARDPAPHLRALGLQIAALDVREIEVLRDGLLNAAARERDSVTMPPDKRLLAALCDRQRRDVRVLATAAALIATPRRGDVRDLVRGHDRGEFPTWGQ